ncbi:MAG TPA: MlaD family protein [Tepidisphaeraceae bacterium]|nr:MlaD family protein [Tepidisphaeraceae bacterium]
MKKSAEADKSCENLPKAKVSRDWKTYLFWIVPIGAACLAAYFIYTNTDKGPTLHIYFANANGLQSGKSIMKYRGATVGEVKDLELTPDQKHVDVIVTLKKEASNLARENSKFWIVRAQIGAARLSGLGTIVSGDYITVEPGGGKHTTKFQGLAQAPVVTPPKRLNIVLIAERMDSLQPRTPVFYRGLQVGEVSKCELGPQAQTVHITLEIQRPYAPLVRMNSVFWRAGGINMNLGLNGANISAQSFKTLISGGIDFATPDTSQKPAMDGTAFRLYEKPQELWLTWSPAIKINVPTTRPAISQSVGGGL